MHGSGPQMSHVAETVHRGRLYLEAGADCVYPILASEPDVIRTLVDEIGGPVNVLAGIGAVAPHDLARLGVARISYGDGLHREVYSHLEKLIGDIKTR